jgi:4-amino-4-deoxy-L-arabinose transferase-like glycosyltransferase
MRKTPIRLNFFHAIPLLFIICMVLFFPFRHRIEFNPDEGLNAMKAMMNMRGYQLYSEIWNDQPPFFTMLMTLWFRVFGLSITAGRELVLLFSATLLWLATQYLRQFWESLHAYIGFLIMIFLPLYLDLSVSIMIGLPAIALALLSFFGLSYWQKFGGNRWLILSACALGLSIMVKLFTAILTPVFLLGILLTGWLRYRQERDWIKACKPSLIWLTVFLVTVSSILILVVKPANIAQLFEVHLNAADAPNLSRYVELQPLIFVSRLKASSPVLILAFIGGISAFRSRSWTAMYLVAWVAVGSSLLWVNVPFWDHHQLLITVPSAILAAIAIGDGYAELRKGPRSQETSGFGIILGELSLILIITYMVTRLAPTIEQLDFNLPNLRDQSVENSVEQDILDLIRDHAQATNWVYTDSPMFAFRAQLPVPPQLAVISKKRLATGALTEKQILQILEEYKPELALTGRFDLPMVSGYFVERDYSRIFTKEEYQLYVHQDILQNATSPTGASSQE